MSAPRVDVVIPSFNSRRFVFDAIESLLAQTMAEWRCVVVDDGSTDGTAAAIEGAFAGESRLSVVRQPNQGVAAARNNGLKALPSASPFALFLDADDILEPAMLEKLSAYLDEHPEAVAVHSDSTYTDVEDRPLGYDPERLVPRFGSSRVGARRLRDDEHLTPFATLLVCSGVIPSMTLIRRDAFDAVGGFDELIGQPVEDTDLFMRLALRGEIHFLAEPLIRYRVHESNSIGDELHFRRQAEKLNGKWSRPTGLSAEQDEIVRAAWRWRDRRYVPYKAVRHARRELARGRPLVAGRYLGGAARVALRSWRRG